MKVNIWGEQRTQLKRLHILSITLFIVIVYKGMQYAHWGITGMVIERLFYVGFMFCFFFIQIKKYKCNFRRDVLMLMILPFLSMINTYYLYAQGIIGSVNAWIGLFTWMIYFLLHKYKVSERSILYALLCISFIILIIQGIQQFTYPEVWFGRRSDNMMLEKGLTEVAEMRNGIWRFRMHNNAYYTVPVLFAIWSGICKKFDMKQAFVVLLLLVSVYLTLTRQVMVSCIFTMVSSLFMFGNNKHKVRVFLITCLLIAGLYVSYEMLFSNLVEQTTEEKTDDNIRVLAALFFWNESTQNPILFLFGHGLPSGSSAYTKYILDLRDFGFYTSDIGFIGQIYEAGFLSVFCFYLLAYKLCFKYKEKTPQYIKMFVLFTTIMSPMIFPILAPFQIVVWALLLYVCDLHINNSSLALSPIKASKKE